MQDCGPLSNNSLGEADVYAVLLGLAGVVNLRWALTSRHALQGQA